MRRYNQSAHTYDTQYHEEQEAKITTIMHNIHLKHNSTVLDAGCGTGILLKHLTDTVKLIVGIDISRNLLKKAREKAQHYQNVALVLADADNQPFPQHTFDAAFAVTLLQNTPSPKATLTEIQRVSKQNAMIAVTGLRKKFTQNGFLELLNQAGLTIDSLKQDKHNREYVGTCHKTQS